MLIRALLKLLHYVIRGVISLPLDYFKKESSCISALKALGLWGMGPGSTLIVPPTPPLWLPPNSTIN